MRTSRNAGSVFLLLAASLAITPAWQVRAEDATATGGRIVAIDFVCAAPIDADGLLRLMPFQAGTALKPEDLATARARLTATAIFTDVSVDAVPRAGGVAVVAHLVRKKIINAVRFRGNHTLDDDELGRVVRLRPNTVMPADPETSAVARLRERYAAEGFESPQIAVQIDAVSSGEADVTFQIDEGPPVLISAIEISKSLRVESADKPQDVRRELGNERTGAGLGSAGGPPATQPAGEPPALPEGSPVRPEALEGRSFRKPADAVDEEEIRDVLGFKSGDRYVRAQQRTAQTDIVRLFRRKQYYDAEVRLRWERGAGRDGVLHVAIDPGPLFTIRFTGNDYLGDKDLLGLMDLETRPVVTDGTWRELGRRAQHAYQEAGYYNARVDVRVESGPPKVVRFDVSEGESFRIGEVQFEGNHALSAATLLQEMATRPPSWVPWRKGVLLDDVFADDLKRLWFLYRRYGFEAAEIVDARTRFEAGTVFVTVIIEEGRQTIVREVTQVGTEPIAGKAPKVEVAAGRPLSREQVENDRRALLDAFAEAGYSAAAVTTEVQTTAAGESDAAKVRFTAVPGAQQHVGTIIVQDDLETRWRVVLRELPFKSGDPLSPEDLLRAQANLSRLGLFRSVTVRPLGASLGDVTRDIGVSVSEKPAGTLQWGAGYNTRDGFRGFTEVAHNNLQGLNRRLSLRGEFSALPQDLTSRQFLADLGFREPRLGDTKWSFRSDVLAQRSTRTLDQYSLERFAWIPAIERFLLPGLQVGLEPQIEQSQVFNVNADVLAFNPRDAGRLRSISLGPFAIYDQRDDPFVPRRGMFDSVRVKFAPGEFGSDIPFIKVLGQHSHYIPLTDDLTFVYAARAGWARVYEGGEQVPIRERFFLGGRTTVRGFSENVIGPAGNLGNPLGGDWVVNVNTELLFPLVFGLSGEVFVDGGGVYLQDCPSGQGLSNCAVTLDNFRRSAGLGLRYLTPVGPISLEYGFKLDRHNDESIGAVHFSIGTIF